MSVEENLRLQDVIREAVNAHDWDRFVEPLSESFVFHDPSSPEPIKGREAMRARFQELGTAFPDLHSEQVRAFGQGDWICAELIITGTHKGPLPGPGGEMIPATNREVRYPVSVVAKAEGGKFTEGHQYYDMLGLMTQLGLVPESASSE